MRRLLAIGSFLALMMLIALGVACADDSIPTAADMSAPTTEPAPVSPAEPPPAVHPPPSVANEPVPQAQPAEEEDVHNHVLIMRTPEKVQVFPYPADGLHQPERLGAAVLLLADGWFEAEEGQTWLRLDMNGSRVGWVRLEDSPLSLREAQTLPEVALPSLPTVELQSASGEILTVELLGVLDGGMRVAIHVPQSSDAPVWLDRRRLPDDVRVRTLPVYIGPVWGEWAGAQRIASGDVVATLTSWYGRTAYPRPEGSALPYGLQGGSYPVLGRSLDGEWVALRVDDLQPPVVWLPMEAVELEVEPADMPIFLSTGLQIMTLDDDGQLSTAVIVDEPSRWEWLGGTELLIHERNDGTYIWDTETGERRWITEHAVYDLSPDRRYALRTFMPEARDSESGSTAETAQRAQSVEIVSLATGESVRFDASYHPLGRCGCGGGPLTTLRWSADSTWLFSVMYGAGPEQSNRYLALSIHGQRVEVVAPDYDSMYDWASLHDLEEAGIELTYLDATGAAIERPWSAAMLAASSAERDAALAAAQNEETELGDAWWPSRGASDRSILLAQRTLETDSVDVDGFAAIATGYGRWGVVEFGLFDHARELRHLFRGFGMDCGTLGSKVSLSPDGRRLAIGTKWLSCA